MLGLRFRPFPYRFISIQRDISGSPSFREESFFQSVHLVSDSIGLTSGSTFVLASPRQDTVGHLKEMFSRLNT